MVEIETRKMENMTKERQSDEKTKQGPFPFPVVGLGTADYPFGESAEATREAVAHAIRIGYRHIDTASLYLSEQPIGDAIADALRLGLIKSRNELFITSKLWPNDAHRDLVLPALRKSLGRLKVEYVDLYLIHFPVRLKTEEPEFPFNKDDLVPMDYKSVWEAMEECQHLGLTKFIGVSNFSCNKLHTLLASAKIPPLVNQVEMNPVWQQKKVREFCEKKGIYVIAYSPLGGKNTLKGSIQVMECQVLKDIAAANGKSISQVCLRWLYEQGVGMVVKSFNQKRMQQNLDIFGWSLTIEDSKKIAEIPQRKGYVGLEFVSEHGPFKSLLDLWDEDIGY